MPQPSEGRRSRHKGRIRFERHASQVAFDPVSATYVVTWVKCDRPLEERIAQHKDPLRWKPSVSSVATLYDRGCIPLENMVYAARAIGDAWKAGDRDLLDTESARKAAELVGDLATMCVNPSSPSVARDIGQAIRHLLDEMAAVRFSDAASEEFEDAKVLPALSKATGECFKTQDFTSWPAASKRRRFLYCLNRKERSPVAYTLVSLMFDSGSCPLLSLSDRRVLRLKALKVSGLDCDFCPESMSKFFSYSLERLRDMKKKGLTRLQDRMTSQQLVEAIRK